MSSSWRQLSPWWRQLPRRAGRGAAWGVVIAVALWGLAALAIVVTGLFMWGIP